MATQNIYALTDTWNAGGTTFTAIKMDVLDTASAAGSLLMDLQVGGSSKFKVTKTGEIVNSADLWINSNSLTNAGVFLGTGADVYFGRDAANTLAQRNGTNAQAFRVYNTYTDASNYERARFLWSGNQLYLTTDAAGTGTLRDVIISGQNVYFGGGSAASTQWRINNSGHFLTVTDNTYDIGASGANRPRNVYVAGSYFAAANVAVGGSVLIGGGSGNLVLKGQSSGVGTLQDTNQTDFNRLQFGGTTSSFPSLKRNGTAINVRLADDSADAPLTASNLTLAMTTAGSSLDITNSDPGNLGVAIQTRHTSASPAVDDYVGYWNIRGNDSLGNNTLYGYFQCLIVDPTDGSEKGQMYVGAGGGSELRIGQGVHTSGATAPGDVNVIAARQIKTQARTVAQLPAAGTVGAGTRGWVSDSNVAFSTAVITNIVAGGGANGCPVYSDGTNWRIG